MFGESVERQGGLRTIAALEPEKSCDIVMEGARTLFMVLLCKKKGEWKAAESISPKEEEGGRGGQGFHCARDYDNDGENY